MGNRSSQPGDGCGCFPRDARDALVSARQGPVRVLVTGASGLLGRQIMMALSGERYVVRGLCSSRVRENLVQCDLIQDGQIEKQFSEFKPDVVIHSAAERRPDVVFKQPEKARALNIHATSSLAEASHKHNTWIIFLSTDYVFDGEHPPYGVDATTRPLSTYGEQKVEGEQICLSMCAGSAIVRVPLLFGPMEYPKESGVTAIYEELKKGIKKADHLQRRYPTYTPDIAKIMKRMIDVRCRGGRKLSGIYHWQSDECFTKYDMVQMIASLMNQDAKEVVANLEKPKFPTPPDSKLDCSRLAQELDINVAEYRTPFQQGLEFSLRSHFGEAMVPSSPELMPERRCSVSKEEAERVLQSLGASGRLMSGVRKSFVMHADHAGEIEAEAFKKLLGVTDN